MSTPTFEFDRSPAAFVATLDVDSPMMQAPEQRWALVLSPPSVSALTISHQSKRVGRIPVRFPVCRSFGIRQVSPAKFSELPGQSLTQSQGHISYGHCK